MNQVFNFIKTVVLSDQVPFSMKEEGLNLLLANAEALKSYVVKAIGGLTWTLSVEDYKHIDNLLYDNQKINAIKHLRSITNWGLLEAKKATEDPQNFPHARPLES